MSVITEFGGTNTDADEEVSCWICLDDGPDENGQKSLQKFRAGDDWENPWEVCPSCHQPYQSCLSVDLATEYISFVEKNYPQNDIARIHAYTGKIMKIPSMNLDSNEREEAKQLANKILSMIENANMDSLQRQHFEEDVYHFRGLVALGENAKEGAKDAIVYFEKCLALRKALGSSSWQKAGHYRTFGVSNVEDMLERARIVYEGGQYYTQMGDRLELYQNLFEKDGENDTMQSIQSGVFYAVSLKDSHRTIEAERLLLKIVARSLRVNGPNHQTTKLANDMLESSKVRYASVKTQATGIDSLDWQSFLVLGYEDGGKECIVKGPIPHNMHHSEFKGNSQIVETKNVHPYIATPVICRGLKTASHLNGKVGDIRNANPMKVRFEVHFEDMNLKPCLVKPINLEILFELPAK